MFEKIADILNTDLHPLSNANQQEAYIYQRFLRDTERIVPAQPPMFVVSFDSIEHLPAKAQYYCRLIDNDLTYCLNHYYAEIAAIPSANRVAYWHYQVRAAIAALISQYNDALKYNNFSAEDIYSEDSFTNSSNEHIFTLIAYYALASLAGTYIQLLHIFQPYLEEYTDKPLPSPFDFIFDVLDAELPMQVIIQTKKANKPTASSSTPKSQPKPATPRVHPTSHNTSSNTQPAISQSEIEYAKSLSIPERKKWVFKQCIIAIQKPSLDHAYIQYAQDWRIIQRLLFEHNIITKENANTAFINYLNNLGITISKMPKPTDLSAYNGVLSKSTTNYPKWQKEDNAPQEKFNRFLSIAETFMQHYEYYGLLVGYLRKQ